MHFRDSRIYRHNARVRSVRKSCIITKVLTCSFCFRLFIDAICNNWTATGFLADNYMLAKDFYGGEAD